MVVPLIDRPESEHKKITVPAISSTEMMFGNA